MFGKKKKESKPSTLEEVKKAYEDLSDDDKKSFHQSIADRVHESIAAQEREHGQEDSQSAEAREHEALGEEHAEGKGDVEELHEKDDTPEERREDSADEARIEDAQEDVGREEKNRDEVIQGLADRIGALEESLKDLGALKEKMEEYTRRQAERFGLSGKVIGGGDKNMSEMSASELKDAILSGQK